MKRRSKPGSSTPIPLRLDNDLVARLRKVETTSKQTMTAVLRASAMLGLEFLEAHPDWVGPIDGGSLSEPSVRSYLVRAMAAFAESKASVKSVRDEFVSSGGQSEEALRAILEAQLAEWRPELFKQMAANVRPAIEEILKPYLADVFGGEGKLDFKQVTVVAEPGTSNEEILDAVTSTVAGEVEKGFFSSGEKQIAVDHRKLAAAKQERRSSELEQATKPKRDASVAPIASPPTPEQIKDHFADATQSLATRFNISEEEAQRLLKKAVWNLSGLDHSEERGLHLATDPNSPKGKLKAALAGLPAPGGAAPKPAPKPPKPKA